METVERLKPLTLLTYADISAVNPTAMTPWRAEQLSQLYMLTYNELTRELETERISTVEDFPNTPGFWKDFRAAICARIRPPDIEAHVRWKKPAGSAAWRWSW